MRLIAADIWFRYTILFAAAILWIAQLFFFHDNRIINAAFIVVMGGIVGYFTNYLAIRMLFQPKKGKVLGWAGLVPRNQPQIARRLGRSVQKNLLAPEVIINYIQEKQLVEHTVTKAGEWIDNTLQDAHARSQFTGVIIDFLKENGTSFLEKIFDFSEEVIKRWARSPEQIEKSWAWLRVKIVAYLENQENRVEIADFIQKAAEKEVPSMARAMNTALEDYLHRQKTIGKVGLSLKKIFNLHEESMEDVLNRFIHDPETTDQILDMFDALVQEFENQMNDPERQSHIMNRIKQIVNATGDFTRVTMLDSAIVWLREYLNDPSKWNKIDETISQVLSQVKNKAQKFMDSEKGQEVLSKNINKMVNQINVTDMVEAQVMKLDTDELEKMILDNTGGNLVVIQVLGGILGIVAGTIQVHHYFAFPVLGLIGAAWISAILNHRHHNKH